MSLKNFPLVTNAIKYYSFSYVENKKFEWLWALHNCEHNEGYFSNMYKTIDLRGFTHTTNSISSIQRTAAKPNTSRKSGIVNKNHFTNEKGARQLTSNVCSNRRTKVWQIVQDLRNAYPLALQDGSSGELILIVGDLQDFLWFSGKSEYCGFCWLKNVDIWYFTGVRNWRVHISSTAGWWQSPYVIQAIRSTEFVISYDKC